MQGKISETQSPSTNTPRMTFREPNSSCCNDTYGAATRGKALVNYWCGGESAVFLSITYLARPCLSPRVSKRNCSAASKQGEEVREVLHLCANDRSPRLVQECPCFLVTMCVLDMLQNASFLIRLILSLEKTGSTIVLYYLDRHAHQYRCWLTLGAVAPSTHTN